MVSNMSHSYQWKGRDDGAGVEHCRIYQVVNQSEQADFAIIGFNSDEGVKRNHGRVGAAKAPDLIRKQLANLPVHQPITIQDFGNVSCIDAQLEQAQSKLAKKVMQALEQNMKPIVFGGGHEVAYGSFNGLFQYVNQHQVDQRIGIINFDAHFDLRNDTQATSGTPFLQAAHLSQQHGKTFHYLCIGIAKHANTRSLFEIADQLGVEYVFDYELNSCDSSTLLSKVDDFIQKVDILYVTVDLDVFSAVLAPGVSAPAVRGIDLKTFENLIYFIQKSGKIKLLDIAECNPNYDKDQLTARLAAFIAYNYICNENWLKNKE